MQRYVGLRDAGRDPLEHIRRARPIDPFMAKVEELVAHDALDGARRREQRGVIGVRHYSNAARELYD